MVIKGSTALACIFLLTGCPGQGDRFRPDETTQVKSINSNICLPPLFYPFADNEKYIVELVLISPGNTEEPGKCVVGVGVNNDRVYNFPLTDREITRPYGAIQVAEE